MREDTAAESIDREHEIAAALAAWTAAVTDDERDWATFELGTRLDADGSDIRAALWACLDDPFVNVRDEALMGLARRRVPGVGAHLRAALGEEFATGLVLEAVRYLSHVDDPQLRAAVERWYAGEPGDEEVRAAWEACDPGRAQARATAYAQFFAELEVLRARHAELADIVTYCPLQTDDITIAMTPDADLVRDFDGLLRRVGGDPIASARFVAAEEVG
jgi:hypothetical protein